MARRSPDRFAKGAVDFRVRRTGEVVRYVERIAVGEPIRDMAWTSDGRLALLLAYGAHRIAFLSRSSKYCDRQARQRRDVYAMLCASEPPTMENQGAIPSGKQLYARHCSACHATSGLEQHDAPGPSLAGVVGRPAGSVDGYDFSEAPSVRWGMSGRRTAWCSFSSTRISFQVYRCPR